VSAVTTIVAAGSLAGWGLWLAWSGWAPARAPLADTLDRLGQPLPGPATDTSNLDARLGRWALRIGIVQRVVEQMRTDLRLLGRAPDEQAALIVAVTIGGLLWAPIVTAAMWMVGLRLPIAVPLWLAVAGAGFGAVTAIRSTRSKAAERRRGFSHALGAFCDVAGMCMASGRGIDASIHQAAGEWQILCVSGFCVCSSW